LLLPPVDNPNWYGHHMIIEDVGDALCYHAHNSGPAVVRLRASRPLIGPIGAALRELVMSGRRHDFHMSCHFEAERCY
jgi:hypothetical protein